jgi:hypothetical protein
VLLTDRAIGKLQEWLVPCPPQPYHHWPS